MNFKQICFAIVLVFLNIFLSRADDITGGTFIQNRHSNANILLVEDKAIGPCYPNPCIDPGTRTKCVEVSSEQHTCLRIDRCPSGSILFERKCYYVSDVVKNWLDAKGVCTSMGMILAEPHTTEDIAAVKAVAQDNGGGAFYIGAINSENKAFWVWNASNVEIIHTDWYQGEPNDVDVSCAALHSARQFKWVDFPCSYELLCVCEKQPI